MSIALVPPLAVPYVARARVRRDMLAFLEQCRGEQRVCLMNLHGLEGLGVSCLATQFHRDNARLIDGGLIWLAGRTSDGRAAPPAELLGRLLKELGVPEAEQGASEAERATAFRRLAARHSGMIVIDDLAAKEQVVHLLSVDAPGLVIVVTTPFERRDLIAEGFRAFTPEFLVPDDARELIRAQLGETADAIAPGILEQLVGQCGGIPLLIKIVAAALRGRAHIAEALLAELVDARLDVLELDDERRMSRFFDVTYGSLPTELAEAYRHLALLPGTDFGAGAAAAALERRGSGVLLLLERLVSHNLLVSPTPGRYAFHPVVRGDARARALAADNETVRDTVVAEALTWYVREALPRAASLSGRWWADSVTDLLRRWYGEQWPTFSRAEAMSWFDVEVDNLVAVVTVAPKHGLAELAPPTCVASWKYLHVHRRYDAWIDTHREALSVARDSNDLGAVMQLSSQLGAGYLALGETSSARELFDESHEAARALDHPLGQQSAMEWKGKVAAAEGDHGEARRWFRLSWEFTEAAGERIDAAQRERIFALLGLQTARSAVARQEWLRAADEIGSAARFFDSQDDETDNQAKCRVVLGQAQLGLGDAALAASTLGDAVDLFGRESALRSEAEARVLFAKALAAADDSDRAVEEYQRALTYLDQVGNPAVDEVRQALSALA